MSASRNEELVRLAIEAIWNRGELDVADTLFAADYVNHDGVIADIVLGPESIKVSAAFYRLAFPDLHVIVEELTTDDEMVVLRWRASRGADGTADTWSQKSMTGITRSRVAGGKIIESWTEWNRAVALHDLRLIND